MDTSTLRDSFAVMEMPELSNESREIVSIARACRNERSDPDFADDHDGMTFDEYYAEGPCGTPFANSLAAKSA
jgi:hypothetical protein